MRVQDFKGVVNVSGAENIEPVLKKQYGDGFNSFWLSHGNEKFPVISMLVAGELATIHYFPHDGHPGFRSIGNVSTLDPDEMTAFYMNNLTEEEPVSNDAIVTLTDAVKVAEEFSASKALPTSIEWLEL